MFTSRVGVLAKWRRSANRNGGHASGRILPFFLLVFVLACGPSPQLQFARTAESAASWAAAVQFIEELSEHQGVPRTYVHDTLRTGADTLAEIRNRLADVRNVNDQVRSEAAQLCDELATMLQKSNASRHLPDAQRLRAIEQRLRELAAGARDADRNPEHP